MTEALPTLRPPKPVSQPPPPPIAAPPTPPRASNVRLRVGGPALDRHLAMAMEALHAEQLSAAPTFKTRVVDVENISFTLHEKTSQEQSAASFAMQHRALPATDMTGLRLWNCSLCLVQCLMSPTELPHMSTKLGRPLRIVELGAGTGLLGLAVANRLERSSEVVLTDPDVAIGGGRTSLDVLRANIEANVAKSPSAAAAKLLWGSAHDIAALVDRYGVFDVAVGSELLYCEDSVAALAETVVELGVAMCVLAQQTRPAGNVAIEEAFIRLMEDSGYVSSQQQIEGTTAVIHRFERAGAGPQSQSAKVTDLQTSLQ